MIADHFDKVQRERAHIKRELLCTSSHLKLKLHTPSSDTVVVEQRSQPNLGVCGGELGGTSVPSSRLSRGIRGEVSTTPNLGPYGNFAGVPGSAGFENPYTVDKVYLAHQSIVIGKKGWSNEDWDRISLLLDKISEEATWLLKAAGAKRVVPIAHHDRYLVLRSDLSVPKFVNKGLVDEFGLEEGKGAILRPDPYNVWEKYGRHVGDLRLGLEALDSSGGAVPLEDIRKGDVVDVSVQPVTWTAKRPEGMVAGIKLAVRRIRVIRKGAIEEVSTGGSGPSPRKKTRLD